MALAKFKRKRRRKRRKMKRKQFIPRLLGKSYLTKMRYTNVIGLDAGGVGGLLEVAVSAGGIFDTLPTIGGIDQPVGHDQMYLFFNSSLVLSSKIKITHMPTLAVDVVPAAYGIILSSTASTVHNNYADVLMGNEKRSAIKLAGTVAYQQPEENQVSLTYSGKEYWKTGFRTDNHKGSSTANPDDDTFFLVYAASTDNVSNPPSLAFLVEVEYIVLFDNPVRLENS